MKIIKNLVSIIIPVYNRAGLITQTLNSVFDQTYSNIEIIVIDDGSIDNLKTTLENLIREKKITYFYQDNAGLSSARNKGIQLARGEYINFLDSDDLLIPEKTEKQVEILRQYKNVMVVNCNFNKFDNSFIELGLRDTSFFHGNIYPEILWHWSMLIATPCLLIRRKTLDQIGNFDVSLDFAEDLDMWCRISKDNEFFHIPESLVNIRDHNESLSHQIIYIAEKFKTQLELAFERDINLPENYKNKSLFNMYKYSGLNYIGNSNKIKNNLARIYLKIAFHYKRLDGLIILGYIFSYLPKIIRVTLYSYWRKFIYKRKFLCISRLK